MVNLEQNDVIWRLETGSRNGPYGTLTYNCEGNYNSKYHPAPWGDDIPSIDGRIFGFANIHDARRWWCSLPDLMSWEESHDAKFVIYLRTDCVSIVEGGHQCVFEPKDKSRCVFIPASWLHTRSISALMEYITPRLYTLVSEAAEGVY